MSASTRSFFRSGADTSGAALAPEFKGAALAPGTTREGAALEWRPGRAYDEGAFLYFLAIERSRAERANHALWLLLVSIEPAPGKPVAMGKATAAPLFAGLGATLRDTDVVGWYRQDRVAAAVLRARDNAPGSETSRVIQHRVGDALRQRLPTAVAPSLRLRVIQLRRSFGNG